MGLFLFVFCLIMQLREIRLRPDCPNWLRPFPEEVRMGAEQLPKWAADLLPVGMVIGLMLHFMM